MDAISNSAGKRLWPTVRLPHALYFLIAALFILIPNVWSDFRDRLMQDRVLASAERGDFLASLHNAVEQGCFNLKRFRPDIVFTGDSHAYAAIDFMEAGRHFGVSRVGQCALPGAFLPSISLFLDWLGQSAYRPKTLVYIVSPRQFMLLPAREERLAQHRELLFSPAKQQAANAKWLALARDGMPPFGRTHAVETAKLERHRDLVEELDEQKIAEFVSRSPQVKAWRDVVPTWQLAPRIAQEIEGVCAKVRRSGIRLFVVHAPESPLGRAAYGEKQWRDYQALLKKFDCAAAILILSAAELDLGNRHFVNRYLADDYDYEMFDKPVSDLTEKQWAKVFDVDHPNRIAAERITLAINGFVDRRHGSSGLGPGSWKEVSLPNHSVAR